MEKLILGVLLLVSYVSADIYLGCFLDKHTRLLEAKFTTANDMTIQKCSKICRKAGYLYFGVENHRECFCGNRIEKFGYGPRPGSECSQKCSGDNRQTCGGPWRLSVYLSKGIGLGCYQDKHARLLDGKFIMSRRMTIQKCIAFCKHFGFMYSGVQFHYQCFCGNDLHKRGYGRKPESQCSTKCTGDKSQTCGGPWRLSVYQNNVNYKGCYLDKRVRLLGAKFTTDAKMTALKCLESCSDGNYKFAGLQYHYQCFCGNNLHKRGYWRKPESQCSTKCSGDKTQTCGGPWRLSVYQTNVNYMGCYRDKHARLLEGKFTQSPYMTRQRCIKTCFDAKYQYAGLQYSYQCFCGNNISKPGYGRRPEKQCAAKCKGNKNQMCGGTWRMSVYKT